MYDRRMFFLLKGRPLVPSSKTASHDLRGSIAVSLRSDSMRAGQAIEGTLQIRNIGAAVWHPASIGVGGVKLGIHLLDANGKVLDFDFYRQALATQPKIIYPDERLELTFSTPAPAQGDYFLEFDLVSEGVCWFSNITRTSRKLKIHVAP